MIEPRLLALLRRAGVTPYVASLWFTGCRLEKNLLLTDDREFLPSLERTWKPLLTPYLPDLDVRFAPRVQKESSTHGRLIKPSARRRHWTPPREPENADLF
jgi:hypothetical protein